jgi:hypothetical protein
VIPGRYLTSRTHSAEVCTRIFFTFFLFFAKINGPPKTLHNYTSTTVGDGGRVPTAMSHGGSDSTARWCTLATATAVAHGGRGTICFQNFVTFLFELGWR